MAVHMTLVMLEHVNPLPNKTKLVLVSMMPIVERTSIGTLHYESHHFLSHYAINSLDNSFLFDNRFEIMG